MKVTVDYTFRLELTHSEMGALYDCLVFARDNRDELDEEEPEFSDLEHSLLQQIGQAIVYRHSQ